MTPAGDGMFWLVVLALIAVFFAVWAFKGLKTAAWVFVILFVGATSALITLYIVTLVLGPAARDIVIWLTLVLKNSAASPAADGAVAL
jgi:hypothetical protein